LQVRSDVTRYRYGDEQHLEEALKRIFRYNQVSKPEFLTSNPGTLNLKPQTSNLKL